MSMRRKIILTMSRRLRHYLDTAKIEAPINLRYMKQPIDKTSKQKASVGRRRPPRASYHHGDLREALLAAAERVISRGGLEAFTLRACAREAGVSHAAPAHHFKDLASLRSALVTQAFERLSAFMDRYALEAAPDPRVMLPAICLAYIDFALRHPGLYRLMFRFEAMDATDAVLVKSTQACHARLTRAVRVFLEVDRPDVDAEQVQELSALAWSLIHGFASLAMEGRFADLGLLGGNSDEPDMLAFAGRVLMQLQVMRRP